MAHLISVGTYSEAHKAPNGPGDGRPTALQILKDNDLVGKMKDKTFLITGGTAGLGRETVRTLAKTGARVFFTARNEAKAKNVLQDLEDQAKTDGDLKDARVEYVVCDNVSLKSVKAGAEDFLRRSDKLNVLICNAGIANTPKGLTEEGFDLQFGTNHLAHFYLFQLLKPLLLKSSTPSFNSRVVMVASNAHAFSTVQAGNYNLEKNLEAHWDPLCTVEGEYNPMVGYGQSKTANIWVGNEVDRRNGEKGLHGLSIHPGLIVTEVMAGMDPRVVALLGPFFQLEPFQKSMKTLEQGAATQVFAAVSKEYEGKGGVYLEDCGVSQPIPDSEQIGTAGYRPWAYDQDGAKRLWADSLEMIGMKGDV